MQFSLLQLSTTKPQWYEIKVDKYENSAFATKEEICVKYIVFNGVSRYLAESSKYNKKILLSIIF